MIHARALWSWGAAGAVTVVLPALATSVYASMSCSATLARGGSCGYFNDAAIVGLVLGIFVGASVLLGVAVFPVALVLCKRFKMARPRADLTAAVCAACVANVGGFARIFDEGAAGQLVIGLGLGVPIFLAFGWSYWWLNGRLGSLIAETAK